MVSDPDDVERAGGSGAGVPGKAGRERLRCFNRVGVALLALGTLFALGFAGYRHASQGLSTYDTSHEARAKRTPFPLVAHEIWLGDEMPTVKRLLFERNREILAPWGWELRLWGVGDIDEENFPSTHVALRRGLEHFEVTGDNVWSMVGDLMKFEILYRRGGLYLDTNVELLRDPSPLFWDTASAGKQAFFVADPGDNRFVSAGMIGAVELGSELLGAVISNGAYLDGVDFARHCIANAITGPVMLTAHLESDHKLLDTVSIFDRDVAYPLACGENDLDPCVSRMDRRGGEEMEAGARADATATARSMSGVGSSSLGAFSRAPTPLPPPLPVGVLHRVARTAADVAATAAKRREADKARREAEWPRNAVGADSSWRIVVENDGARWNTTVPCRAVARAYPDSYAVDHFSVGGASWQQNCDRVEKAELMTEWVEEKTPRDAKLVHDWAMSAVRFLGGPELGRAFVKRIRMHSTNGVGGRARLVLVASGPRAGGALLNEMLETAADHPVDSKIWYREGEARADAFFATYVTLGDLWSHGAFERVRKGSWQDALRAYLLQAGVSRAAIDNAHVDPETFVEETLERLWESGVDVVHAMLVPSGTGLRSEVSESRGSESSGPARSVPSERAGSRDPGVANGASSPLRMRSSAETTTDVARTRPKNGAEVLETLLAKFPDSPTVCLRRRNVLDAYVSLYRAEHGDAPWQIVAEPPPAPAAESAGAVGGATATETGVWGLGDDGEKASKTRDGGFAGDDSMRDDVDGTVGGTDARSADPRRRKHRVRFDPAVFAWLDARETRWLDDVEAITKSAGDGRGCESLVYEDALADEARQQKTLDWLNTRFELGLNVEALPLQKLRRVNTSPVTLLDFENPDALDQRARSFLREPKEGSAAGETVDDHEPVSGDEKATARSRL